MDDSAFGVKTILDDVIETTVTVLKVTIKRESHKIGQLNEPRSS
jgi:hypothetical protein